MPTILGCSVKSAPSTAERLPMRSGTVPPADEPNTSAWFRAVGWEASARQWAAANQPPARRTDPAMNAAVTRVSLLRTAGPPAPAAPPARPAGISGGDRLCWDGGVRIARASGAWQRCGTRSAFVQARGARSVITRLLARWVPPSAACCSRAGSLRPDRGRAHTLGAVGPPGCTTRARRRAGTTQEAGIATPRRCAPQVGVSPGRYRRPSAELPGPCPSPVAEPVAGPRRRGHRLRQDRACGGGRRPRPSAEGHMTSARDLADRVHRRWLEENPVAAPQYGIPGSDHLA